MVHSSAEFDACVGTADECDPKLATAVDEQGVAAWVFSEVLTAAECAAITRTAVALGLSFWSPVASRREYRDADTVEILSPAVAATLWARFRSTGAVPERVVIDSGHPLAAWDTLGEWRASHINPHLLVARYRRGGHFAPHTDGAVVESFDARSLVSVITYLNTCGVGGATALLPADQWDPTSLVRDAAGRTRRATNAAVIAKCECVAGSALLFRQDAPHEGEPVGTPAEAADGEDACQWCGTAGCAGGVGGGACARVKVIIRTDVVYRRHPPAMQSDADVAAAALFRDAEVAEGDGDAVGAAEMYRRALKMSPRLRALHDHRG